MMLATVFFKINILKFKCGVLTDRFYGKGQNVKNILLVLITSLISGI